MYLQQQLLRIGVKWEEDEIRKLLTSVKNYKSISDIAMEHQRTEVSIKMKIKKLVNKYFLEDFKLIEATFQDTPEHLKMELKNEIRKKYQENFAAFLDLEKN
jgi:hypothetical protein